MNYCPELWSSSMPRSAAIAERLVTGRAVNAQISFGESFRNSIAREFRRYDVVGLLPPVVQQQRQVVGDRFGFVRHVGAQQVVRLRRGPARGRRVRAPAVAQPPSGPSSCRARCRRYPKADRAMAATRNSRCSCIPLSESRESDQMNRGRSWWCKPRSARGCSRRPVSANCVRATSRRPRRGCRRRAGPAASAPGPRR